MHSILHHCHKIQFSIEMNLLLDFSFWLTVILFYNSLNKDFYVFKDYFKFMKN